MPEVKWTSERERDVARKRDKSKSERLVIVPPCEDVKRRLELEADNNAWLRYYFGDCGYYTEAVFWYDFTPNQRRMIDAIDLAVREGGDQALADSRGGGKTVIFRRMSLKFCLQGVLKFPVLFGATGGLAEDSLQAIKHDIEFNEKLKADYPEACVPVRALEDTPNRAHYMVCSGFRHDNGAPYEMARVRFSWCGPQIRFPNVPGSPSARAMIATRGLDSAIVGLNKLGVRPDLAGIDDADTEETVYSEEQANKLESRIDRSIGGLGSQQKPIARVMLCTIRNRNCVAWRFTDKALHPSFRPERFRFLNVKPQAEELWSEFVELQKEDWDNGTNKAEQLYLDKRATMDDGAEVSNPYRHTATEHSALQHYYTLVARYGPEAVATEYDNDPPEDIGPIESGITATKIQQRLSGYPRYIVPPECTVVTQGIDVQQRGLHWVVKAWRPDATNYVIDYSFLDSKVSSYDKDSEGVELAIYRTILARMDDLKESPYKTLQGEAVPVSMTLIDSGWLAGTIYSACKLIGLGIHPTKGHGQSRGCVKNIFTPAVSPTKTCKPGDRVSWRLDRQDSGVWLVNCAADYWKSFEHARWLTPEGKPGASYLFGEVGEQERRQLGKRIPQAAKEHFEFCKHLTAEIEVEDVVRGTLKRFWKMKTGREQNHYLDASYLADLAAGMVGIRLVGEVNRAVPPPSERPTAAQLAGRK